MVVPTTRAQPPTLWVALRAPCEYPTTPPCQQLVSCGDTGGGAKVWAGPLSAAARGKGQSLAGEAPHRCKGHMCVCSCRTASGQPLVAGGSFDWRGGESSDGGSPRRPPPRGISSVGAPAQRPLKQNKGAEGGVVLHSQALGHRCRCQCRLTCRTPRQRRHFDRGCGGACADGGASAAQL